MPHPDPSDRETMRAGVLKRFLMQPPQPSAEKRERLRKFVQEWIEKNMTPLEPTSDTSVPTWIEKTNYPRWRKEQLLEKWKKISDPKDKRHFKVKSFMKDETYPEYKHARAINSRTDEFKTMVGPIFKLIEKELFKLDWFIKKVPLIDRPKFITERIGHGRKFFASDYVAYESHFTRETMELIEFQLYDYMTQLLPDANLFKFFVHNVLGGTNECVFKFFEVQVKATRMSGEMCTSLGNGFSNLMLMLFECSEKGCTGVTGVVEGDDGLFTADGELPTAEDFARSGFTIKIELFDRLSDASFCGLIFDPKDQVIVTNPLPELASFGLTTGRYARSSHRRKMELLKCKSISLAYQYGGCPILTSLAKYGLRITKNYRAKAGYMNEWERAQFLEAKLYSKGVIREVPRNTRLLVERLYGITIETQIRVEEYLDSLEVEMELEIPALDHLIPQHWKHYWFFYATQIENEFSDGDIAPAPPH